MDIKGQTIAISGFGNVAWGVATKATELGAEGRDDFGPRRLHLRSRRSRQREDRLHARTARVEQRRGRPLTSDRFAGRALLRGRKPWERQGRHRHAVRHAERARRRGCRETARQRSEGRGRGLEHGLPPRSDRRLHRGEDPLRAGQGGQCRRRRHVGTRDEPELA